MRPRWPTDWKNHTHCSQSFVSLDWQVPIAGNHWLSLLVHLSSIHHHSLGSIHFKLLSCLVESMHHLAMRDVDSRPSVLLHPSDVGFRWFWNPLSCEERGNQTCEHQSGYQSSYWLRKNVPSSPTLALLAQSAGIGNLGGTRLVSIRFFISLTGSNLSHGSNLV